MTALALVLLVLSKEKQENEEIQRRERAVKIAAKFTPKFKPARAFKEAVK